MRATTETEDVIEVIRTGDSIKITNRLRNVSDIERVVTHCLLERSDTIRKIVESGFDCNQQVHAPEGYSIFHLSINLRDAELVDFLISNGAKVNESAGVTNQTPVELAFARADLQILTTLLKNGADPKQVCSTGDYPVHLACHIDSVEFLKALVEFGADVLQTNHRGQLPIHVASARNLLDHIEFLTEPTGNINIGDSRNRTPLHYAARHNNNTIITWLLNHGADDKIEDDDNESCVDIWVSANNKSILGDMVRLYTERLLKSLTSICEVFCSPLFDDFVKILTEIDDVKFYSPLRHGGEIKPKRQYVATEDDESMATFGSFLVLLNSPEQVMEKFEDKSYLENTCILIVRCMLDTEDTNSLIALLSTDAWPKIETCLVEEIEYLYLWSISKCYSAGALQLVKEMFVRRDELNISHLTEWVALVAGLRGTNCSMYSNNCFKNPLKALVTWAILAGKLSKVPLLLRLNHIDIIPYSLYASSLLIHLSRISRLSMDIRESFQEAAATCEAIAIEAMLIVDTFDPASVKTICMQYLRTPLENFGNVTCLHLAALGKSPKFLELKVCQQALDLDWYDDLYVLSHFRREALIAMSLIPGGIYVPWIMNRWRMETITDSSRDVSGSTGKDSKMPLHIHKPLDSDSCASNLNNVVDEKKQPRPKKSFLQENVKKDYLLPNPDDTLVLDDKTCTCCKVVEDYFNFYEIPAVKFQIHTLSLIVFLVLLSYVVMFKLHYHMVPQELACYIFLLGFLIEEVFEIVRNDSINSMSTYLKQTWNLVDMVAIICGILAFILRCTRIHRFHPVIPPYVPHDDTLFYFVRVILCVVLLCYFVKLIKSAGILPNIGPKLKMMAQMVWKDFLPFLCILFVFMIGFGIVFQALLYPNGFAQGSVVAWNASVVLQSMIKLTFYSMMGDFQLDRIEGESCQGNCPHKVGAVVVPLLFMIIYVVITNLLLLNLVIALFSKTVDDIDSDTQSIWEYERFGAIQEYVSRSSMPPPLNIIQGVLSAVIWLYRRYGRGRRDLTKHGLKTSTAAEFLYYLSYQAFALRHKRLVFSIEEESKEDLIMNELKALREEIASLKAASNSPHGDSENVQTARKSEAESLENDSRNTEPDFTKATCEV